MSDRDEWDVTDDGWADEPADDGYDDDGADGGDGGEYDQPPPPGDAGDGAGRAWLLAVVAVVALLCLGAAALLVASGDDDDDGGESADLDTDSSTTSTSLKLSLPGLGTSSTSTTIGIGGTSTTVKAGGGGGASTTVKPTTTTTRPASTTPTTAGIPSCTRAVSEPTSGNQAMTLRFCIENPARSVGQTVTVYGEVDDPDAQIDEDCISISWEGEALTSCDPGPAGSPPVINRSFKFTHVYTSPGSKTIKVGALSGPNAAKASFAQATVTFTVEP